MQDKKAGRFSPRPAYLKIIMAANPITIPGGGRVYLLDALRICLCAGVVVGHYAYPLINPCIGPFAVTGFFVLSGFLISLGMHREKQLDVCRFYNRKCRRLLPMFVVGLLLGFVCRAYMAWRHPESYTFIPGDSFDWGHFSLVHFINVYNGPLWYMGIEFAFLLTVPFLYSLNRTRWGLEIIFAGSALFSCFLFSKVEYGASFGEGLYYSPVARFWQFMAGIVAARALLRWRQVKVAMKIGRRSRLLCTALFSFFLAAGMVLIVVKYATKYTFSLELHSTLFYMLLIPFLCLQPCTLGRRVGKCLRMWSDLSYPVFLVHVPLHAICMRALSQFYGMNVSWETIALVATCMTLILARLMLYGQKRYFSA